MMGGIPSKKRSRPVPRDPTVHELHNGPERAALPPEVQRMEKKDTVCKFCGVSYLVFSEIKELEKRLANAERQAADFRSSKAALSSLQEKVTKMVEAQKSQLAARDRLLAESSNQRAKLNVKISGLKCALSREKKALGEIRCRAAAMFTDTKSLLKSARNEVDVLGSKLQKEQFRFVDLQEENKLLKEKISDVDTKKAEHDSEINDLRKHLEILEQQWREDVERLETAQAANLAALRREHKTVLEARAEEKAHELQKLEKELSDTMNIRENEHKAVLHSLKEQLQSLGEENVRLSENNGTLLEKKTGKLKELKKELDESRKVLKFKEAELTDAGKRLVELQENLSQARVGLSRADHEIGEGRQRLAKAEQRAVEWKKESESLLNSQKTRHAEVVRKLEKRIKEQQKTEEKLEQMCRKLENTDVETKRNLKILGDKCASVELRAADAEASHCAAIARLKETLSEEQGRSRSLAAASKIDREELRTTKLKVKELEKQLCEHSKTSSSEAGELKATAAALQGRIDFLENENSEYQRRLRDAPTQNDVKLAEDKARAAAEDASRLSHSLQELQKIVTSKDVSQLLRPPN